MTCIELQTIIAKECGCETAKLDNLYAAVLSIQTTSVESERCFSASGLFITNFRTRMSDETFDSLTQLRSYFSTHKNIPE